MQIDPNGQFSGTMVLAIIAEIGEQHSDRAAMLEAQRNDALNAVADARTDCRRLQRLVHNLETRGAAMEQELTLLRATQTTEGQQQTAQVN